MGTLSFETIHPAAPPDTLPARIEQSSPRLVDTLTLLVLAATALALVSPFVAVALHLADAPEARALVFEQPRAVLQLGLGLAVWTVLLGWPARRLAQRLGLRRVVTLTPGMVRVEDAGLLRTRHWSAPVATYSGLAHHVRASLSGVRHELILVHPDPARSVLLAAAPRFAQGEIERMCGLIGVNEVPARLLYTRPGSANSAPTATTPAAAFGSAGA